MWRPTALLKRGSCCGFLTGNCLPSITVSEWQVTDGRVRRPRAGLGLMRETLWLMPRHHETTKISVSNATRIQPIPKMTQTDSLHTSQPTKHKHSPTLLPSKKSASSPQQQRHACESCFAVKAQDTTKHNAHPCPRHPCSPTRIFAMS